MCRDGACATCGAAGQPACGTTCNARLTVCAGVCRDLQTDEAHCGACGSACVASTVCRAATCVPVRPRGSAHLRGDVYGARLTACADTCRDVQATRPTAAPAGARAPRGSAARPARAACVGGALHQLPQQLRAARRRQLPRVGRQQRRGSSATGPPWPASRPRRRASSPTRWSWSGGRSTRARDATDGSVQCWGANTVGQLGDESATTVTRATPAPVPGLRGVESISAGSQHTCVVRIERAVQCWGTTTTTSSAPATRATGRPRRPWRGSPGSFVAVAAGTGHTCARRADGAVYCWGSNANGELGDGAGDAHGAGRGAGPHGGRGVRGPGAKAPARSSPTAPSAAGAPTASARWATGAPPTAARP